MTAIEILLLVNSALLALIGMLLVVVRFFLKAFHGDFKKLVERTTELYKDHHSETAAFRMFTNLQQKQLDKIQRKLGKRKFKN